MATDKYIYVKSDESNSYFIDNTSYKFKVQLKLPLYLYGKWKVALVHFHATEKGNSVTKVDEGLYIYSDLCQESIVYGEERPLLRRIEKSSKGRWDYTFNNPFYVPVKKQELRDLEIYIKREHDKDAIELMKPVYLTLHLKRYPFF
jgi:hypothetical protein